MRVKLWTSVLFLLTKLDYLVALPTYLTVTRLRSSKGVMLKCTDQLLDSTTEEYMNLNVKMCHTLAEALSHSRVHIKLCQIHKISCEDRLPLVSTRLDLDSDSQHITSGQLHSAFNLNALVKDTVVTIDYLQIKDFNECKTGKHDCHENAVCSNTMGGFTCNCKRGYVDSGLKQGRVCDVTCGTRTCANYGACVTIDQRPVCRCAKDFTGRSCEVRKRDVEWVWILGITLVIFTLIVIPAAACLVIYLRIKRKTGSVGNKNIYKSFG